jgi:hypothetical protein
VASIEAIVGGAIIVAALLIAWAARPNARGPVRRFATVSWIEPYFAVLILAAIMMGTVFIAVALGVA